METALLSGRLPAFSTKSLLLCWLFDSFPPFQGHFLPSWWPLFVQCCHRHAQGLRLGASQVLRLLSHWLGQSGRNRSGAKSAGQYLTPQSLCSNFPMQWPLIGSTLSSFQIGASFSQTNVSTFVIDSQVTAITTPIIQLTPPPTPLPACWLSWAFISVLLGLTEHQLPAPPGWLSYAWPPSLCWRAVCSWLAEWPAPYCPLGGQCG